MTAAILAQAPRQSAILSAAVMLHVGVFIVVAGDKVTRQVEEYWIPPVVDVQLPPPEPEPQIQTDVLDPMDFVPEQVPMPEGLIPPITEAMPPTGTGVPDSAGTASSGSATPAGLYEPPTLDMRDSRLLALIDSCYPSTARRLGNEGRAQVNLVIDAEGRASSWSLAAGTGFSRLDSAVDCVVRRLKFQPARRDGHAVVAEVRQSIVFRLN